MGQVDLWKEEYKLGNEVIDAQHEELFHKIEELLMIAMTGDEVSNRNECTTLLDFLVSYTVHHFETEEALQKELGYISYPQHARIHREFTNTILTYKEKVEKDFSKEILKKLVGTLMTWLTMHVCDCDKKSMSNQSISPEMAFDGSEDIIRRVVVQFLAETNGIGINKASTSLYKGYVEGKIIVRTMINSDQNYVFLFGFSEEIAKELYNKISGLEIENINELNAIESSALIELGDIISSYALAYIHANKHTNFEWRGDIFLNEYSDSVVDINNSIVLEFDTFCGRLEVLYCLVD